MLQDSSCPECRSFLATGCSACVWIVRSVCRWMCLGVPLGSVLGPLLFIVYTFKLFHIVGNYIDGYADHTAIYAVILIPISRPQVIALLNRELAAFYSWC